MPPGRPRILTLHLEKIRKVKQTRRKRGLVERKFRSCSKCHAARVFSGARCWKCWIRRHADVLVGRYHTKKKLRYYPWWKPCERDFNTYLRGRYMAIYKGYDPGEAELKEIFMLEERQSRGKHIYQYIPLRTVANLYKRLLEIVEAVDKRAIKDKEYDKQRSSSNEKSFRILEG